MSAHAALPLAKIWGAGDVASADGMRLTAPSSAIHAGPNPKYFGESRGVTWYNLLSNQISGLNGIVVPGTLRDSLGLFALLLEQETELEPAELMPDMSCQPRWYHCATEALIAGSRITTNRQLCMFPPLGAQVPASST